MCPGSGIFADVVKNPVLDELTYVCAICGADVPNFQLAPVHRHTLRGTSAMTDRLVPAVVGFLTTELDERCVIEK